ncbi:hypothetical protein BDM02DRAFT_1046462 [Thelephora ganbajun]|uniref:Uncharacterized protein n=1 Tax=Thelephora ganbajun TaxID=370292 RepID=A0ACB6Z4F8_THEGA|nr:hypothetical protein BDM02DRAFT_1046462 [Thelephora ganbajun]
MFGEDDSESPRVASPWDPFLASPSSRSVSSLELSSSLASCTPGSAPTFPRGIPKLVPEAEQGNVEYKLKLTNPTPARFARLVTQLKWRLLEGGGQACYELGVTDDGLLIGLSRGHLEQSLETLEMMAGEIGASVVVVKEIEVSRELAGLNEKLAAKYIDFDTGEVRRADRSPPSPATPADSPASATSTSTESESEQDSASGTIFSLDPELGATHSSSTIDLEISSVYKPRPMRARASFLTAHAETVKHRGHHGKKKHKQKHSITSYIISTPGGTSSLMVTTIPTKQQTKQAWRQQAKDRRNDVRRAASSLTQDPVQNAAEALIPALDGLHVSIDPSSALPTDDDTQVAARSAPVDDGPRFIVEALVVRKLSLEEAFLDFGGFGFEG